MELVEVIILVWLWYLLYRLFGGMKWQRPKKKK